MTQTMRLVVRNHIREQRERRGISVCELMRRTGMSPSQILVLERCASPKLLTLATVAFALNCKLTDLFSIAHE